MPIFSIIGPNINGDDYKRFLYFVVMSDRIITLFGEELFSEPQKPAPKPKSRRKGQDKTHTDDESADDVEQNMVPTTAPIHSVAAPIAEATDLFVSTPAPIATILDVPAEVVTTSDSTHEDIIQIEEQFLREEKALPEMVATPENAGDHIIQIEEQLLREEVVLPEMVATPESADTHSTQLEEQLLRDEILLAEMIAAEAAELERLSKAETIVETAATNDVEEIIIGTEIGVSATDKEITPMPAKAPKKPKKAVPEHSEPLHTLPDDWKGEKQYYTIGEVAELFKVKTSHIRFWTNEFELKVRTTRKGDRLYTPQQVKEIKAIHHLVKERGFTLNGAKTKLKNDPKKVVVNTVDLKQQLSALRLKLVALKRQLK